MSSPRTAPRLAAAILLLGSWPARAFAQEPPSDPPSEPFDSHEDSWVVPSVHGTAVMTGMRIGEAIIWPEPFADLSPSHIGSRYEDAYTMAPKWDSSEAAFEWDGDPWYVNAVGHALFGSELFVRARLCRKNVLESLAFTTAGSAVWEYVIEANGARPSALDLWYSPAAGLVLGEARFQLWRASSRIAEPGWRSVLTAVLDPFGELERLAGTVC